MYKTSLEILKLIEQNGFKAYIVGGYPRDIYLNRNSIDIDICTNATPQQLTKIFSDIKLSNLEYGSVTLYKNNIRFEITTFRKDIQYINNRKPIKIEYIQDLYQDLQRRDFTINTMCIDSSGTTIDLLNSKKDLDNKLIRTIGNSDKKIEQDVLRILRAIRFATVLDFKLDSNLKKSIVKYGHLLKKLSYQRKKHELDIIFSSTNSMYGIDLIKELKLDKYLELNNINNVLYTSSDITTWAQLDVLDIYPFTKQERDIILKVNELERKNILDKKIIYKYGLYICTLAGELKGIDRKQINIIYNSLPIKNIKEIDITVNDITKILNKNPGPYLKTIYTKIEQAILSDEIDNKYENIKNYLEKTYL